MTHSCPDDIARALARVHERLGIFGGRIEWRDEVGSTNDVVAALAAAGADEGHVVAAGMQSSGRGRRGRSWSSPPGAGVYASALLRPPARVLPLLTLASGVAIAEGIQAASGLEAAVKWPNDLVVAGGGGQPLKLAGILTEAGSSDESPHVVVGFGVNVGRAVHPADIAARSSSIEVELGRPIDRGLVLSECLAALWRRYGDLRRGEGAAVLDAWRRRATSMFGRRVEWDGEAGVLAGVAVAVDDSGALVVRSEVGERRVMSGEVRWV